MKIARYISEGGEWLTVKAEDYDSEINGKDLRCGDPCCEAKVRFRKAHYSHGTGHVAARFISVDKDDHIQGCKEWRPSRYSVRPNSVSENKAVSLNLPFLLNVNIRVGNPFFGQPIETEEMEQARSRYNSFREGRAHASISVHSLSEFFNIAARLEGKDSEALNRTYVAHCQDYRFYHNVAILDDENKKRVLYNSLTSRMTDQAEFGFMRVITARPRLDKVFQSRPGAKYTHLQADSTRLEHDGDAALILLDIMQFSDPSLQEKMITHDEYHVAATPYLLPDNVNQAKAAFEAGRRGYVRMFWRIDKEEQFQPSENAEPTEELSVEYTGAGEEKIPVKSARYEQQELALY